MLSPGGTTEAILQVRNAQMAVARCVSALERGGYITQGSDPLYHKSRHNSMGNVNNNNGGGYGGGYDSDGVKGGGGSSSSILCDLSNANNNNHNANRSNGTDYSSKTTTAHNTSAMMRVKAAAIASSTGTMSTRQSSEYPNPKYTSYNTDTTATATLQVMHNAIQEQVLNLLLQSASGQCPCPLPLLSPELRESVSAATSKRKITACDATASGSGGIDSNPNPNPNPTSATKYAQKLSSRHHQKVESASGSVACTFELALRSARGGSIGSGVFLDSAHYTSNRHGSVVHHVDMGNNNFVPPGTCLAFFPGFCVSQN